MRRSGTSLGIHSRRRRRMIAMMSEYTDSYEAVDPSPYLDEPVGVIPVSEDTMTAAATNPFAEDVAEENELEAVESISVREIFGEMASEVAPPAGDIHDDDIQWGEEHRLDEEYDAASDPFEFEEVQPQVVSPFDSDDSGPANELVDDSQVTPPSSSEVSTNPFADDPEVLPAAEAAELEENEPVSPFADELFGLNEIRQLFHVERPSMWMFLGDEITLGSRRHVNIKSYVDLFAERVRDEMRRMQDSVVNAGIPGRTASVTLHELQHRLRLNPTVVALQFGLHDVREKEWHPDRFKIQMLTIIDQIRIGNAIPLLQSPPRMKLSNRSSQKRFDALNAVLRELADEEEVPLIDHAAYHEEHDVNGLTVNPENGLLVTKHHSDARMAFLLFQELDIFDTQSELCRHVSNLI